MAYGGIPPTTPLSTPVNGFKGNGKLKPVTESTKSVSYVASGTNSNKIMSFSQTANTISSDGEATAVNEAIPSRLEITNVGLVPL